MIFFFSVDTLWLCPGPSLCLMNLSLSCSNCLLQKVHSRLPHWALPLALGTQPRLCPLIGAVRGRNGSQRNKARTLASCDNSQGPLQPWKLRGWVYAPAATTSLVSFSKCPVLPHPLPFNCSSQEYSLVNLHAIFHLNIGFQRTQSKAQYNQVYLFIQLKIYTDGLQAFLDSQMSMHLCHSLCLQRQQFQYEP